MCWSMVQSAARSRGGTCGAAGHEVIEAHRGGGVNMQRPQRRVSAARTNDVDTDERRETIIDEGAGPVC
jgi:hypothetical protein